MSMNLRFKLKDSSGYVSFPWQTRTNISYSVLNAKTSEEKLKILRDDISHWEESLVNEKMEQVKRLLSSEHLELIVT